MACNNCFNGCAETVSDQCVKYTGISIPQLGITTGDSLSSVELAITDKIITIIAGTGIVPNFDTDNLCTLVSNLLPTVGDITLNNIIDALIQVVCNLDGRVEDNTYEITQINADYVVPACFTGVIAANDGTHIVLQEAINKICQIQLDLTALALDLETNYISVSNIDSYIEAYIASTGSTTLISSKMVPYSILPYYGDITGKFDSTGAGLGDWDRIFLCNGNNPGVPDFRGRIPVGITSMSGGSFPAQTDPSISGNPNYNTLGIVSYGANQITLNSTQIPSHTHVATSTVVDPGHTHEYSPSGADQGDIGTLIVTAPTGSYTPKNTTDSRVTGITVSTVNTSVGGGLAHSNIQPVISVYYIIYIP